MRKVSYNIQIITLAALLLAFIGITFYLTSKINAHGNINLQFVVLVVDIFLFGLLVFFAKIYLNFIKGDDGEMDIRDILYKLKSEGFHYLSDVIIGDKKGNIDCVVVGPTGVWTIEAKNLSERVIVHDKYLDKDLKQAYAESKEVENLLMQLGYAIPVASALVFTNKRTRMNFGLAPVDGVYVIGKKWLDKLLTTRSTGYLSPEQCLEIKEKLKPYTSKLN